MKRLQAVFRSRIFLWVGTVLLIGGAAYVFRHGWREAVIGQDPERAAQHLLNERQRLDATTWSTEVLAQQYEETAIALWDQVRAAQDKWAVLARLRFEKLKLARLERTEELSWGIHRTRYEGHGRVLDQQGWRTWLESLHHQGYVLVQGEIHHQIFDPPERGGRARSVFSVVGHLRRRPSRKLIVEGHVEVIWSSGKNAQGHFLPDTINVLMIDVTAWKGPAVMRETLVMYGDPGQPPNQPVQPLLVYDADRDGDADILLPRLNALYRNEGEDGFAKTRLFRDMSPVHAGEVRAAVAADFDADGLADIFLFRKNKPPLLYWGRSGGEFSDAQPVNVPGATWENPQAPTAGDVDGDGDLDVWIGQYRLPYTEGNFPTPYYDANDGYPSYLLLNQGHGRFTDATVQAGLAHKRFRRNYSASLVDVDDDGDLDLITVNDFAGLDIFKNDGRGHFTDVSGSAADERALFGMAHMIGDFNLDGKLDLYVIGMSSTTANRLAAMDLGREEFAEHQRMRVKMGYGNRMLLGDGSGRFTQAPWNDQVAATGWSWGVTSMDIDTDGDLDLYVANGHVSGASARDYCTVFWRHDIYTLGSPAARDRLFKRTLGRTQAGGKHVSWNPFEHNVLLMNRRAQGVPGFTNVGFLMGLAFEMDSRAAVSADLNRDGRPDLVLTGFAGQAPHQRGRASVLENHWPRPGHWIGVELREEPGQSAMGARIRVATSEAIRTAWIVSGDSFECQHPSVKLFGLGPAAEVEFIEVRWAGGKVKRLMRPPVDQYHYLRP